MPTIHRLAASLATVIAASAALPAAHAASVLRNETSPAVKVCQPALPAYDAAIRKRPRAMQNEGTATAFVTCALEGRGPDRTVNPNVRRLSIYFTNSTDTNATVTCTALDPVNTSAESGTATRSASVGAGSSQDSMLFLPADINPTFGWSTPAVSCALPPGVGITNLWYGFVEDNGV